MRRRLGPLAAAAVLLVALWLPAVAAMPDDLGGRQSGSYVCTDATTANCNPGVRGQPMGVYNASPLPLGTGGYAPLQVNVNGYGVTVGPLQWSVTSVPGAGAQATASRSAGAAGVRHVATCVTASISANTVAPAAKSANVNLIDGATGGTTYLWRTQLNLPASAGAGSTVNLCGLNLAGTAATAMTLEFQGAGDANTFESVTLTGYDAG